MSVLQVKIAKKETYKSVSALRLRVVCPVHEDVHFEMTFFRYTFDFVSSFVSDHFK